MTGSEGTATLEPPAARLRGVRKRFGYQDVLRGVDLEIPRGGIFVIFGPNGAGKSTILRLLATQWSPTAGTVEVLGHDVRREPILIRSQLGLVFHESFLRRELTVEENLRFASELHGIDSAAAPERIERLLGRFGILHRKRDAVGTLSQGMTKRASLARSLLNEPRLWILDEPFSGLDPAGQDFLEGTIREYAAGGSTVVLVTHQAALGARLASSSAWIEDGRVARSGSGSAALDGPDGAALRTRGGEATEALTR